MKKINTKAPWTIITIIFVAIILLATTFFTLYILLKNNNDIIKKYTLLNKFYNKEKNREKKIDFEQKFLNFDDIEELNELEGLQEIEINSIKRLGYIKSLKEENSKKYIEVDYIDWLQGDEAKEAMVTDGECLSFDDCIVDNDYYIKNDDQTTKILELDENASFIMQTYKMLDRGTITENENIVYSDFARIFQGTEDTSTKYAPYHLTIKNDIVTEVIEQYVP